MSAWAATVTSYPLLCTPQFDADGISFCAVVSFFSEGLYLLPLRFKIGSVFESSGIYW